MRPKNANFTMEINEVQTKIPDIRTRDGAASVATRLIVETCPAAKAPVRMEPEDIVGWWQKWCKNRTILSPAEVAQVTKRKDAAKVIDEVNGSGSEAVCRHTQLLVDFGCVVAIEAMT